MTIVNESGLYNLIFQSRKPEARKFRKWVTGEILPSIRKTGRYEVGSGKTVYRQWRMSSSQFRAERMDMALLNLLWLIEESLNKGDCVEVALELGVSKVTVSKVLHGRSRNAKVLMALYRKAKENRSVGMLYVRPDVMAARLQDDEIAPAEVTSGRDLPPVIYGKSKRGGQPGNQNARKHWGKEGK